MAVPVTRSEFKEYCLRALGAPVIEINVDDDQVEDRIDYALKTWWDYHFDGSEKVYYKFPVDGDYYPGKISEVQVIDGGTGYSNGEFLAFSELSGSGANVSITTDNNGAITGFTYNDRGSGYGNNPTVTINTSGGTGASLIAFNGGYIPLPDNIIGAVRIFNIGDALNTNNLFNIRYQIALNDLYTLTSVSMVPYFLAMQHIQFLEYMLVGMQPIRYNRHKNKLYIDMSWEKLGENRFIIVEAYEVVDPVKYTDAWSDRWLIKYCTALIKQQWGNNLKKFGGMQMPGGLVFNGQRIYDEATDEIKELEERMIVDYSLPVTDLIG